MTWNDVVGISFDLGGTLIREERGPATAAIGELFGVELSQMRAYLGHAAKRRRESPEDLGRRLANGFRRPGLADAVIHLLEERRWASADPVLFDDAEPVLATLRQRGYRIALLSNVLGAIAPPTDSPHLVALADVVLMSCDSGHLKPEREAFTQVETLLGARSEQLAHVGDSLGADVQGALDAGWTAVHIDRADSATTVVPSLCTSLTALTKLLDLLPCCPAQQSGPIGVVG